MLQDSVGILEPASEDELQTIDYIEKVFIYLCRMIMFILMIL